MTETALAHIAAAWRNSLAGLQAAWRTELAFRIELSLCAVLLPAALLVGRSPAERALLVGSCLAVLVTELLNSAIEAAVDRVGDERHELSGRAKDLGSAAVCLSLAAASGVWILIGGARLLG